MRKFSIVALLLLFAAFLIPFPAGTIGQLPEFRKKQNTSPILDFLPLWFKELDKDGLGQIDRLQWEAAKRDPGEFREYDLNGDGIITADEVRSYLKKRLELKLEKAQAKYKGPLEKWTDEQYRGKRAFKIFAINLEQGKTYQIDEVSKEFDPYLFLEDANGKLLAENDDGGDGLNARIVYRADKTATYRIIATSQSSITGAYSLTVRVINRFGRTLPKGLPWWFTDLDKDGDGQISLSEWREGGRDLSEFRKFDLNGDDLITADELLRTINQPFELKRKEDRVHYTGTVEESLDEPYRGKKSFKILQMKVEQGKSYQIDHISPAYQAFLYLEDSAGKVIQENSSPYIGGNSRIVFRAETTGIYRIIATSLGGFKTGEFSLSIRFSGGQPKGLPSWFYSLDKDGDGQISLKEWRAGGRDIAEFRKYDLNGDDLITADELTRYLNKAFELKGKDDRVNYEGTIEESADEEYHGKKSFRILPIKVEQGKTYQIDHTSQAFQAFLYLEDGVGNVLQENSSPQVGGNSRIIFRAAHTATYRIIATSEGGFRTGDFSLSIRYGRLLPEGLPAWFNDVDKDEDGQISLKEWREAGREIGEFRKYDLNGDDLITPDEILRYLKK